MPNSPVLEIRVGTPAYSVLNAFRRDRSRRAFICGPLGSGKTFAMYDRLLQTMCEQAPNADGDRPSRWVVIRNTYSQLETTTIKDFRALFADQLGTMVMGNQPAYRTRVLLEDGTRLNAEVIFLALDREDAVSKLRGFQLTGGLVNETKELVKPIIDMLDLRVGRYPSMGDGGVLPTWHGIIGDTNAPDTDHWYYKLAEETRPVEWAFFRQPGGVIKVDGQWVANEHAENLRNLPPRYYTQGVSGKSEDWISVNLGNEYGFSVDGKPVHPEYHDSVHCPGVIPYDPRQPIVLGVDFGRTPAALMLQPTDLGRYHAIDEFVTEDMSQAVFGPALKRHIGQHYPGARIRGWGDPAGDAKGQATEDTPLRILQAAGIPIARAPSNQPTLRRAALANPLMRLCIDAKPGLLVSSKCKLFRKGLMGGWAFRQLKVAGQERYDEQPDKGPLSHICEAGEYGMLGEGEGIAALRPADYDDIEPFQHQADMW